jgi:hypothetical protein
MPTAKKVAQVFASDISQGGASANSASLGFEVTFDTLAAYAVDALNATDGVDTIPPQGDPHPSDANLTVRAKQASRTGKVGVFKVTVQYGTTSVTIGGDKATSPLDRPTRWSSRPKSAVVEVDRDSAGALLLTSAKQVVRVPIQHNDEVLVAVKNIASLTDYTAFFDRVNSSAFQGRAPKTLYLGAPSQDFTEELYEGETIQYWQTTWPFEFIVQRATADPSTWEFRILNEGTVRLDDSTPAKQIKIQDQRTKAIISQPTKLDSLGKVLDTTAAPLFLNDAGATPTVGGLVDMYRTADFTTIGL